jgi:hypothetical protein
VTAPNRELNGSARPRESYKLHSRVQFWYPDRDTLASMGVQVSGPHWPKSFEDIPALLKKKDRVFGNSYAFGKSYGFEQSLDILGKVPLCK